MTQEGAQYVFNGKGVAAKHAHDDPEKANMFSSSKFFQVQPTSKPASKLISKQMANFEGHAADSNLNN